MMICGINHIQDKSDYGTTLTKLARPLPLEYLIVEVTTTTPLEPCPTLSGGRGKKFPIENRTDLGEPQVVRVNTILCSDWLFLLQDFSSLIEYLQQQQLEGFLPAMSDLHLLIFLYTNKIVPLKVLCYK